MTSKGIYTDLALPLAVVLLLTFLAGDWGLTWLVNELSIPAIRYFGLLSALISVGVIAVLAFSYVSVPRHFQTHLLLGIISFALLLFLGARHWEEGARTAWAIKDFAGILLALSLSALVAGVFYREEFLLPLSLVAAFVEVSAVFLKIIPPFYVSGFHLSLTTIEFIPLETVTGSSPSILWADFFFYGFFLAVVEPFRLDLRKNAFVLTLALWILATLSYFLHYSKSLPGIPLLVLFFFLLNWKALRLKREEVILSIAFFIAVILVFGIAILSLR